MVIVCVTMMSMLHSYPCLFTLLSAEILEEYFERSREEERIWVRTYAKEILSYTQ